MAPCNLLRAQPSEPLNMRLPNAPLVEVVFELRWALEGPDHVPVQLRQDPGFQLLAHEFQVKAKAKGFNVKEEMASQEIGPLGHQVVYRFKKSVDEPFPLWQIGPGIFACNVSTEYEWSDYRILIKDGLLSLFKSYPKTDAFDIRTIHLELRYLDAFNEELLGHLDLFHFMNSDVNIKLTPSDFLNSDVFENQVSGQIILSKKIRNDIGSLQVEIGVGSVGKIPSIIMRTKIVKKSDTIDLGRTTRSRVSNAVKWADSARGVSSPFFKDVVSNNLMKTFS